MTRPRMTELARRHANPAALSLGYTLWAPMHRRRSFRFAGREYRYHAARYNHSWSNERTVELPIVLAAIAQRPGARMLEIGNVLSHYGVTGHTVVDKYERAPGVHNIDVVDFHDETGFDLIVSISTLEHIGLDEDVREPDKPARVVEHLAGLLGPAGVAIITFPIGYNPALDELLATRPDALGEVRALRRVSFDNRWVETSAQEAHGARFGEPYPFANAVVVATRTAAR